MKKLLLSCIALSCLGLSLFANDLPEPGPLPLALELPPGLEITPTRTVPECTFSVPPTPIITSFYDYMIGSFNNIPLKVISPSNEGGYFMTYHGRRTPTGMRRVFYSHLSSQGIMDNNSEISNVQNNEGYPALAYDPVSGKPMYAWHVNYDADTYLEDVFVSDALLSGISGLFNDPQVIQNAPITISPSNAAPTSDNEFLWPSAVVGPSPIAGKRRVYVVMRNNTSHTFGPCSNAYIRFADFNAHDIEFGEMLTWNTAHFSVPELDNWNHDDQWRRPAYALTCDNAGNIYLCGYHSATQADGVTPIIEPDLNVFRCDNYGEGTWSSLIMAESYMYAWNPPSGPHDSTGYFKNSQGVPYTDQQLVWQIMNSGHMNAAIDDNGKIHVPGLWGLSNADNAYYAPLQFIKEYIFDTSTLQFSFKEIYPQQHPDDNYNLCYQPWDTAAPWGVVDSWGFDTNNHPYPNMTNAWNFPYWDASAHDDAMMFHYNNLKMTDANGQGMMALVWQSSYKARLNHLYDAPIFEDYENTPEIFISVTADNGQNWSDPIVLNNVITLELNGIKPMWVYPADKIIYTGLENGRKVGKLGLMFYNDNTWGANVLSPPVHPAIDGGQVMFTELRIVFPQGNQPVDPFGEPVILNNNMYIEAGVRIAGNNASAGDVLAAYVEVNGIPQLRGKQTVRIQNQRPWCPLEVFSESEDENVYFKIWDASSDEIYDAPQTLFINFGITVGDFPNDLHWINGSAAKVQNIRLNAGWNMLSLNVHPSNTAIDDLIYDYITYFEMLKSPEGVYLRYNPCNSLHNLSDGKGYLINMNRALNFLVEGNAIDTDTPIPLNAGWNLTGFTPQSPMLVSQALQSLGPNLLEVRGMEGTYSPTSPTNTLSVLSPGKAYWINLSAADTLIYPQATARSASPKELQHEN